MASTIKPSPSLFTKSVLSGSLFRIDLTKDALQGRKEEQLWEGLSGVSTPGAT